MTKYRLNSTQRTALIREGYYTDQINRLLGQDAGEYGYNIKINAPNGDSTKWLGINAEELAEILHIFQRKEQSGLQESSILDEGATLESHSQVVSEIRRLIHSGVFCSMLYIKANGELRPFNIHKEPMSAVEKLQGMPRYDPADHNLLRIWDNNAVKKYTDDDGNPAIRRGDWRSAKVDGIVYFKKKPYVYDFTEINADKIGKVDQNMLNAMVKQMGIFNDNPTIIKVR